MGIFNHLKKKRVGIEERIGPEEPKKVWPFNLENKSCPQFMRSYEDKSYCAVQEPGYFCPFKSEERVEVRKDPEPIKYNICTLTKVENPAKIAEEYYKALFQKKEE